MEQQLNKDPLTGIQLTVRKAEKNLTRKYDEHLKRFGLRTMQFNILRCMDIFGEVNNKQLQELLFYDQTTLSRNIKNLLELDFIVATPGSDKRERMLQLTEQGKLTLENARLTWSSLEEELQDNIDPDLLSAFQRVCSKLENF